MVEDSEDDALLAIRALNNGGYDPEYARVETAGAMRKALQEKTWDIILCDYQMPKFNGLTAIALLKETGIDLPLIIVSGAIGEETAADCMRSGAQDYIMKGTLSRLVPSIERELKEAESRRKQKQLEKTLKESQDRFHLHIDNSPMAVIEWDSEFIVKRWTGAAEKIFGWRAEETIGKPLMELRMIYEEDIPIVQSTMQRLTNGKSKHVISSNRNYTKNGEIIHCEWYNSVLLDTAGKMISIMSQVLDVTARKRAQEALQESEERLRDIIFSIADWVWEVDEKGVYTYSSQQGTELFGESRGDIIGKTPFDFMPPDEAKRVVAVFSEIAANKAPIKDLENWNIRKDGERVCLLTNGLPILDEEGNLKGYRGVDKDITEHKKIEEKLMVRSRCLDLAQSAAKSGVWDWDVVTGQIEWSDHMFNLLGLDPQKSTASFEAWGSVLHSDDAEIAGQRIDKALKERTYLNSDYRILLPDGQIRWVNAVGKGEYDVHGRPVRMLGVCMDITDRKRSEETLLKSEKLYRSLFEGMLNGFAYCRMLFEDGKPHDFIYLAVNDAFESQTGLKNVVGKKVTEVIPSIRETDPQLLEIYGRVAMTGQPEHFEIFVKALQMWFSISVYNPAPEHFVAVFDVITERKRAQAELIESKALIEAVVENVPLMIFLKEATDLRFVIFNRAGEELLGYDRRNLIGKNNLDLFPSEQAAHFMAKDREVLEIEAGMLDIPEEPILTAGKGERFLHTRKVCIRGPDGATKFLLGISEDITERKQAEEELRDSEERFRRMFHGHNAIMLLIDHETGAIRDANHSAARFYGYSTERLCQMNIQDINTLDAEEVAHQRTLAIAEKRNYFIFSHRLASGEVKTVEVHSSPITIRDGTILFSIIHDITERKQAEEKLEETLESLSRAVGTTIQVMVSAVERRDPYTAGHQNRSAGIACTIAKEMGLPQEKIMESGWQAPFMISENCPSLRRHYPSPPS